MHKNDYLARAELYLGSDREKAKAQGPRGFRTAAQALRFALEEVAPVSLHGASLQVGSRTYAGDELTWLYRSHDYPLPRKAQDNRRRPTGQRPPHGRNPRWKSSATASPRNSIPAAAMQSL